MNVFSMNNYMYNADLIKQNIYRPSKKEPNTCYYSDYTLH